MRLKNLKRREPFASRNSYFKSKHLSSPQAQNAGQGGEILIMIFGNVSTLSQKDPIFSPYQWLIVTACRGNRKQELCGGGTLPAVHPSATWSIIKELPRILSVLN